MVTISLGSVREEINSIVPDIQTAISGAPISNMVERNMEFVIQYTGDTAITTTNIVAKYQGPIVHLTLADVLAAMNLGGADVSSISLGDFSVSKGGETNLTKSALGYREMAMEELKRLGKTFRFAKAFG